MLHCLIANTTKKKLLKSIAKKDMNKTNISIMNLFNYIFNFVFRNG